MKILFAEDEKNIRTVLADELRHLGHTVIPCADGLDAIELVLKESFDVLLLDLDMPKVNGLSVLEQAKKCGSDADVIILTGKGTLESMQKAVHQGIAEFLMKPYTIANLEKNLNQIAERREHNKRYLAMMNHLRRVEEERKMIGNSPAMQEVHRLIDRIATTESTVVILGETGTGKELVAREIHEKSPRFAKPFVAVNCGALPETLIESELFGHRKGSFTGADTNRVGLLEVANGGTLFLDEIGELPKGVQAKLLRFLESGEVRKIGENTATICDVRVVCATLRNLEMMVQSGEFREDLWFRINTFEIHLPPLKDRREDISMLIEHFVTHFRPQIELKHADEIFTPKAYEMLQQYDWPGNVRQLANTIEHALILSDDTPIDVDSLPQTLRFQKDKAESVYSNQNSATENKQNRPVVDKKTSETETTSSPTKLISSDTMANLMAFEAGFPPLGLPSAELPESTTLRDLEMRAIAAAMNRHGGNKVKASEELGITLKTLYNKLNHSECEISSSSLPTKLLPNNSMANLAAFETGFSSLDLPLVELPESTTLRDLEMMAITAAMNRHSGNKVKAAEELGITLRTLYNKLNQSEKRTA
jgi:two-component system NtrC family response regulator